jgi:hypothetical protein
MQVFGESFAENALRNWEIGASAARIAAGER